MRAFEAFDPGRFISNGSVFARVETPRIWLKSGEEKSWYTLDVDACPQPKSADAIWVCAEANAKETTECTPGSVDGCPMTVLAADNATFVEKSLTMRNGSVVVATKAEASPI
ncbi:hypothetical protein AAVH_42016 [Aphelenchoides avenae]|nr:hypothetical protein AAVH_42016 [Aphelenchus avenae]